MATHFPHLLSPIAIGCLRLRNRIVMGPMHTGLESLTDGAERLAAFYAERARGGVALIITGGFSPNAAGAVVEGRGRFDTQEAALAHRSITDGVHREGASILLQILHGGGYARHAGALAASPVATPFCPVVPRALGDAEIEQVIEDHVRCARLARSAGYDGVDLLGAGGYLLNGFFSPRTNRRSDRWGGSLENRARLATSIVRRIRAELGSGFAIAFRLSLLDLVEGGSTIADAIALGRLLAASGVDLLGTAFGWHESRVPTISALVPPAPFANITARLRAAVDVPVMASNRIQKPEHAEQLLARGEADLVSLARPMLADPEFASKAAAGQVADINLCLACNQGCLDHTFSDEVITCIVNPRACHETEWPPAPALQRKSIAVIGAGLGGLACAAVAASRGLRVTVFEAAQDAGGQFALASRVPGKREYRDTIEQYVRQVRRGGGHVLLGHAPTAAELEPFEHVVVANGVRPNTTGLADMDHPKVMTYEAVLRGSRDPGRDVIVVGAGGIAFDVAEALLEDGEPDRAAYFDEWGISSDEALPGALGAARVTASSSRRVTLLQRGTGKPGRTLGRTTGWARRMHLQRRGLRILTGCMLREITDEGVSVVTGTGEVTILPADSVVVCIGQRSRDLPAACSGLTVPVTVIGGARDAQGLDAGRSILEGWRAAYSL